MEEPTPLPPIPPATGKAVLTRTSAASKQPAHTDTTASKLATIIERLGIDVISAGSAALLVSPAIYIIDRGIIENASGKYALMSSIRSSVKSLFRAPHRFIVSKPFGLVYGVYFATYLTANSIDTTLSIYKGTNIKTVTAGTEKFVATSGTNMGLSLYKDRQFARMFGTIAPRPLPFPSYLLFSTRDAMTIFFSFNLPPLIAPYMPQHGKFLRPETYPQMLAPAVCQIFSTPLHLLGLDFYNRREQIGFKDRWEAIRRNWAKSALARMGRILPAFGFGGVTNSGVRRYLLERLSED